ncbi:hypothetical protein B4098_3462 [Heyndrickxia coagulans]|uniref:Uncharacterized protein n=1 Tax=Heyndrickxia coagulans TaxID=1398 RepID=A0A150JTQ6_HEYCO|nr:hypothetical protein B4098_3462 [Heyndrickxia coagulans]
MAMKTVIRNSLYFTYEELKQANRNGIRRKPGSLYFTYEELKHGIQWQLVVDADTVCILPMRN